MKQRTIEQSKFRMLCSLSYFLFPLSTLLPLLSVYLFSYQCVPISAPIAYTMQVCNLLLFRNKCLIILLQRLQQPDPCHFPVISL